MSDVTTVNVLVIGGGITGACVARDAAMRGLSVMVVERYDVAFGTSSRSSRLLHGGIRYLAQGRIGLVYEASREKMILGRIAPHLVEPLAFVYPSYKGDHPPLWQLRIGVKIYDWLCGKQNFGASEGFRSEETVERVGGLNPDSLKGAVRYFDALTHDARLVLDTLRSANKHGARIRSYTRFIDADPTQSGWSCRVEDTETGVEEQIDARCVVNATGPWSDRIPHSATHLRPTKGIHLTVDRDRFPVPDAVVMTEGKRILFAIPWGRRTYLGTTDTDYDGPLEDPDVTREDIDYVLGVVNGFFPDAELTPYDLCSAWSGIRPLVASKSGKPSDISRKHEILMPEPGWWDVTGGKLTTCRLMGEQAVDQIVRHLKHEGPACRTADEPLCEGLKIEHVSDVIPPPPTREAIEHYCREEWARHLDDIMMRRTSWVHYLDDPDQVAEQVAVWMADCQGWDEARTAQELQRYLDARSLPPALE